MSNAPLKHNKPATDDATKPAEGADNSAPLPWENRKGDWLWERLGDLAAKVAEKAGQDQRAGIPLHGELRPARDGIPLPEYSRRP